MKMLGYEKKVRFNELQFKIRGTIFRASKIMHEKLKGAKIHSAK